MHHLVIVESPTKAKTIRKFLGPNYTVLASMGHVRDLPESSKDVPAELKKTKLGQLGVDPDHDFEPLYLVSAAKKKVLAEIKQALKQADELYLATDEDREGESISWHLLDLLKPKIPVKRLVFHEITRAAIEKALAHPRQIDQNLVHAQEARRILDRLVGYEISPLLWRKISYGLSAGRVQSAALKAIVDRERARLRFQRANYWDVLATLDKDHVSFSAKLISVDGKRVAGSKDFAEETGELKPASSAIILTEERAKHIALACSNSPWHVLEVEKKRQFRRPAPPFTTSTLQQESNRKLGLSSKETMRAAQSLYERGLITYMRTDSVHLSPEAISGLRELIVHRYGKEYAPNEPRSYATTSKGAQEAHEAIRPSLDFTPPHDLDLNGAERSVYELIWIRAVASQMKDADVELTAIRLSHDKNEFQANGQIVLFPGFFSAYKESADEDDEEATASLPEIEKGSSVRCEAAEAQSHETKPPNRFSEAGLIQYMEKVGIGRPSTYATIVSTLLDRNYVRKQGNSLVPTFTGMIVTQYMERAFPTFVDARFTAHMEERLDHIADGKEERVPYLRSFYFGENGLRTHIDEELKRDIDPKTKQLDLPQLPDIHIHIGRFGTYVEGTHPRLKTPVKANIPDTVSPADLTPEQLGDLLGTVQQGPTSLGQDPESGEYVFLRSGSFGPYVQLGEEEEGSKKKPKRASIPPTIPREKLTLETALFLLSLPRSLGEHPETHEPVKVGIGRFGPYVVHGTDFRSLKGEDSVFTVTLARALELLREPKRSRGGKVLKNLGNHPKDGKPVTLHEGKFGPYLNHGKTNVTVKDIDIDTLTIEQAVEMLAKKPARKTSRVKRSTP